LQYAGRMQGTSQIERAAHMRPVAAEIVLPESICFRVTRYCNARCGFCLAPPDGAHPDAETLIARLDWVLARGVRTVHFCGGEPTIHPAIVQLIEHSHCRHAKTRLTTNGIAISDEMVRVLRARRTDVKISLHGDREHHNQIVGCDAFDRTTENLRRLAASGVRTTVQTTIVAGGEWVVEWMAAYCQTLGIRRLSFLPFIPRGNGNTRRAEYEFTGSERGRLHDLVRRKRKELSGRLDLRWLDFTLRPVPVLEADGRVVLEGATESLDRQICEIPCEMPCEIPAEKMDAPALTQISLSLS
jgi:MoaA/NifB/PqqE/SkfB family radical SAM enzyme